MRDDLKQYYSHLNEFLTGLDKEKAVEYAIGLITEGNVSLVELYEQLLAPVLNGIVIERAEEAGAIWKEHVMSGIVRTIVECAYPYMIKEACRINGGICQGRVMVLCPEEEYHELGARMGADFYALNGFEVYFIGGNTPQENFISAFNILKPDIVSISVTNYLNLISLKKIIKVIRDRIGSNVKLVLSGSAFSNTHASPGDFGADAFVSGFDDIKRLRRDEA